MSPTTRSMTASGQEQQTPTIDKWTDHSLVALATIQVGQDGVSDDDYEAARAEVIDDISLRSTVKDFITEAVNDGTSIQRPQAWQTQSWDGTSGMRLQLITDHGTGPSVPVSRVPYTSSGLRHYNRGTGAGGASNNG